MKKTAIAVVLAGFATVSQAAPKDETWYFGDKLGWFRYHDTSLHGNGFDDRIGNGPTRDNQLGAGAFIGYQMNRYLGFEVGYDWLGRIAYKGSVNNGAFKSQGISLITKVSYPVTDALDVYSRVGSMVWHANSKGAYNNGHAGRVSASDTGISPLAAIGVEYAWTKNWATRLDYQWVNNIGYTSTVGARPDNALLSIGVSYNFGHDEESTPADPVPAVVPISPIHKKQFRLKSDVLFRFNEAILSSEGQEVLDQLYSELNAVNPTDDSVVVLGYADRIGSDVYNQKLSQARTQSVVNYLISKGIPSDKISAHGMGKANPVTRDTCNDIKDRAEIMKCLAPDRRVEIEIKGIK